MSSRGIGLLIIGLGLGAIVVGALVAVGAFGWFGRLPGDIRIEGDKTRVFIPITSMIIVSVAVSLLLALLRRLF